MDGRTLNRMAPALPADQMKTYAIHAPLNTHFRDATCEESDCQAYQHGWRSTIDETSNLGQMQAHYIRRESGRGFTEEKTEDGMTVFTFKPGQKCFQQHKARLDRAELFVVRDGDWRGNPRGTEARVHKRAADWVDDFAEHQDRIHTLAERG